MTQPSPLPYAPPAGAAPPRPRRRGRLLLIGCGGSLLAALLGLGTCVLAVKGGMAVGEKELGPVCDRYLNEVAAGDFHAAYTEADPTLRQSTTEEAFSRMERGIHERTGALRTKTINAAQAGVDGSGRWGRLVYKAEFEKGPGTIRIDLRKQGEAWKIAAVNYQSPRLEDSIRSFLEQTPDAAAADE